jgi:NAD(P)-dependent dehydrogenase (short-subunit alcohol dehydrogenase family)
MNQFTERHVVVTGGTGALGTAVVGALVKQGAWCHVPSLSGAEGSASHQNERVRLVPDVDLRVEDSVVSFYADLPPLWASIHLAGGFMAKPVLETSLSDLETMLALNVSTCFLCCREAVRAMRKHEPSTGRIVNVTARPALAPVGGMIAYSTAKSAVAMLTQSLAQEVKSEGILVNAIAPSIIDTAANRRSMPGADYGTWPSAEEVAEAILFLASEQNQLTSGAVMPVYGQA